MRHGYVEILETNITYGTTNGKIIKKNNQEYISDTNIPVTSYISSLENSMNSVMSVNFNSANQLASSNVNRQSINANFQSAYKSFLSNQITKTSIVYSFNNLNNYPEAHSTWGGRLYFYAEEITGKLFTSGYFQDTKDKNLYKLEINEFSTNTNLINPETQQKFEEIPVVQSSTIKKFLNISGKVQDYTDSKYENSTIVSGQVIDTSINPNKIIMIITSTKPSEAFNILYQKYDKNKVNEFSITGLLQNEIPPTITGYIQGIKPTSSSYMAATISSSKLTVNVANYRQFQFQSFVALNQATTPNNRLSTYSNLKIQGGYISNLNINNNRHIIYNCLAELLKR